MFQAGSNLSEMGRLAYFHKVPQCFWTKISVQVLFEQEHNQRSQRGQKGLAEMQGWDSEHYRTPCRGTAPLQLQKCTHGKPFQYLALLFSLLFLIIEPSTMPKWSTIKDQENSVQPEQEFTYDSQGNNLEGGLSASVIIEDIYMKTETVYYLSDYLEAQEHRKIFFHS